MAQHHAHAHGSDLKDGLTGLAITLVGAVIIMAIAHFMAL